MIGGDFATEPRHEGPLPQGWKRGAVSHGSRVRSAGFWCCLLGYSLLACLCLPFDGRRRTYKRLMRACSSTMLQIAGVELEVLGLENIDTVSPRVFVSNHASMLDMVCVIAGISEEIGFLYKEEMHRIPLFGWALKYGGLNYPIHRSSGPIVHSQLRHVVSGLGSGRSVFVFAEGSRTDDGTVGEFKDGAFYLANKTRVPVVPVTITGTYDLLPRESLLIRSGKVVIVIDRPVETWSLGIADTKRIVRREIMEHYNRHSVEQWERLSCPPIKTGCRRK